MATAAVAERASTVRARGLAAPFVAVAANAMSSPRSPGTEAPSRSSPTVSSVQRAPSRFAASGSTAEPLASCARRTLARHVKPGSAACATGAAAARTAQATPSGIP
jgi:hypothetical protein